MYEYCRPQRQSRRLALGVLAAANGGVGAAGAVGGIWVNIHIYTYKRRGLSFDISLFSRRYLIYSGLICFLFLSF